MREDAAAGFDFHGVLGGEFAIEGEFGNAADAVAAHFGFRAIGVEHAHADGGAGGFGGVGGWGDEDESVAADTEVAVSDFHREFFGVVDFLGEGIDVDVVVADAVHFDETHGGLREKASGAF